jgi:hypothetical protein
MAFCNSCGSNLEPGAKFCPKCGTANPAAVSPAVPAATAAPAGNVGPTPQGSNLLKIVLIIVAVVFGLGIIGVATTAYFVHRAISRTHIESRDGNVKVETPFGTVESSDDPDEAAHNLGIDVYPGATVIKGSTGNVAFGPTHTAAAEFETSDSPSAVADFYKSKLAGANVISSDNDHYSIIAGDKKNLTTIAIEPKDGKTRVHISRVTSSGSSRSE